MEDDDKSRRNLMVVSACILLYVWLEVPANALQKRILGIEDFSIQPWRFWSLLLVAVGYQLHRFITLTAASAAWKQYRADKASYLKGALQNEIREALALANIRRELPSTLAWSDQDDRREIEIGALALMHQAPVPAKFGSTRWRVSIMVQNDQLLPGIGPANAPMTCEIPWLREQWCRAKWPLKQLFASPSTEFWLPVLLGVTATLVCVWELWKL